MKIIKKTNNVNTSYRPTDPEWIVIHYTASTQAEAGTAESIANMFADPKTQASADFIIDKKTIVQYNPDILARYCWAVGGSKYPVQSTSKGGTCYGRCTNSNSISIEMCSQKKDRTSVSASDKDWSIPYSVKRKAVKLTRKLMKKYNIPASHVIMHHHVTGKLCPQPWCYEEGRLKYWRKFKKKIKRKFPPVG